MRDSGVQNNIGPHWLSLYEGEQQKKNVYLNILFCVEAPFLPTFLL